MNESKQKFVDRLLAADPSSPAGRGHYETQVRAMFEKTLSRDERRSYVVAAVLMGLLAAACGFGAVAAWLDRPRADQHYAMAISALMAVALFVIAGNFAHGAWRGVINRRTTDQLATGVGVAFVGLLGLLALVVVPQIPESLREEVRVFGLLLLGYAAVAWVRHSITQSEMKTAERLLEIELRLAEMAETTEGRLKA